MSSGNGKDSLRSTILDAAGNRAPAATMEAPAGHSQYFGWLGSDGYATVRIDAIQALFPSPQRADQYLMVLKYGANMVINSEDAKRLMRRMGWSESRKVQGVTQ